MKILALLIVSFLCSQLTANEIKIHSLCDQEDFHSIDLDIETKNETVGSLTIKALDQLGLEYKGSQRSIAVIENSPTGAAALDYKDSKNMKSYGWCYLVSTDNTLPSAMPDEYPISLEEQNIHWFYAYSEMQDGDWVSFCVPSYLEKPEFICDGR